MERKIGEINPWILPLWDTTLKMQNRLQNRSSSLNLQHYVFLHLGRLHYANPQHFLQWNLNLAANFHHVNPLCCHVTDTRPAPDLAGSLGVEGLPRWVRRIEYFPLRLGSHPGCLAQPFPGRAHEAQGPARPSIGPAQGDGARSGGQNRFHWGKVWLRVLLFSPFQYFPPFHGRLCLGGSLGIWRNAQIEDCRFWPSFYRTQPLRHH